jgi:hypothetical protein
MKTVGPFGASKVNGGTPANSRKDLAFSMPNAHQFHTFFSAVSGNM